jgi:hypothetical protein
MIRPDFTVGAREELRSQGKHSLISPNDSLFNPSWSAGK